jgi:hypothetical protein
VIVTANQQRQLRHLCTRSGGVRGDHDGSKQIQDRHDPCGYDSTLFGASPRVSITVTQTYRPGIRRRSSDCSDQSRHPSFAWHTGRSTSTPISAQLVSRRAQSDMLTSPNHRIQTISSRYTDRRATQFLGVVLFWALQRFRTMWPRPPVASTPGLHWAGTTAEEPLPYVCRASPRRCDDGDRQVDGGAKGRGPAQGRSHAHAPAAISGLCC